MILKFILILHVLSGFLALVTGFGALLFQKGKKWHILAGRIFFWSMCGVAVSALVLSILHPNLLLLFISLLSFYLNWVGYKAIRWKGNTTPPAVSIFDRLLVTTLFLSALIMIGTSLAIFLGFQKHKLIQGPALILLIFGLILLFFTGRDFVSMIGLGSHKNSHWILNHIRGMMASYIATFTAFLVVNNTFLPSPIAWLAPTVIGTPVIIYWVRKYKSKLNLE